MGVDEGSAQDGGSASGSAGSGGAADPAAVLRRMSVKQKVGQLFVVPLGHHSPNALRLPADQRSDVPVAVDDLPSVIDTVRRQHIGGVCYFAPGHQGGHADEVRDELAELTAAVSGTGIDPVLTVDQEGGTVARLRRGVTSVPGAMAVAAAGDPAGAESLGAIVGAELRAVGFHQNYAPVADVNSNPANPVIGVRSFGSDAEQVSAYVAATVRGMRGAGMAATVKHFPGHGDADGDSHLSLPTIGRERASLEAVDLVPFGAAIDAGVDAVMSAHVSVPAVDDSGDPATASPAILTGLLRERLGFAGVVVTDALDMAGARQRFPHGEAAVRALLAGADQLLMPTDVDEAVAAVTDAVARGRVPTARLDKAVGRILAMKARLGLLATAAPAPPAPDGTANEAIARRLARRAVTVLGDAGWRLSTDGGQGRVALVGALAGALGDVAAELSPVLRRAGSELSVVDTGSDPDDVSAALSAAARADLTVVVTRDAFRWPGQRALLEGLTAAGARHVLLAVRGPYDAGLAPAATARFLTYGDNTVLREALVDVLTGAARAGGRPPVDIPGPDGAIVYRRGQA